VKVPPYVTGAAWADPGTSEVAALLAASRLVGWDEALRRFEDTVPFFATRMRTLGN
jgi:hypothetical protein